MRKFLSDKKGLEAKVLVSLIITIVGLVLILALWWGLDLYDDISPQICHQSILLRATLASVTEEAGDVVALNCQSQKICIGKNCDSFEGDEDVEYFKPDSTKELEKFIADEFISCWDMVGQGKLGIFENQALVSAGLDKVKSSCLICSRMAFDKDYLASKKIYSTDLDLVSYMKSHNVLGETLTYEQYMRGDSLEAFSFKEIKYKYLDEDVSINIENDNSLKASKGDSEEVFPPVTLESNFDSDLAILFMQISSPDFFKWIENVAQVSFAGLASGAFLFGPIRTIGAVSSSTFVGVALPILAIFGFYASYTVYENLDITASYCGEMKYSGKGTQGCSMIRTVKYDPKSVGDYCTIIESKV